MDAVADTPILMIIVLQSLNMHPRLGYSVMHVLQNKPGEDAWARMCVEICILFLLRYRNMGLVDSRPTGEWESRVKAEIERCAREMPNEERTRFEEIEENAWAAIKRSECYKFYEECNNAIYVQLVASKTIDRLQRTHPSWAAAASNRRNINVGIGSVWDVVPKHEHEE